jgi:hypothetical protein
MPKDAKELARHSTITLTMDRYAHVGIRDTAAALDRLSLPTFSRPASECTSARATGTVAAPRMYQQAGTGEDG